jgi:hypothetical protein
VPVPAVITLEDIKDDHLLLPVLADDAVILLLDDVPDETAPAGLGETQAGRTDQQDGGREEGANHFRDKAIRLEAEVASLQENFASYKAFVEETLDRRWGDEVSAAAPSSQMGGAAKATLEGDDVEYWESYAGRGEPILDMTLTVRPSRKRECH